jgi:hypothetical protein
LPLASVTVVADREPESVTVTPERFAFPAALLTRPPSVCVFSVAAKFAARSPDKLLKL